MDDDAPTFHDGAAHGPRAHADDRQQITNGRPIPERRRQRDLPAPVAVVARIVWERDGPELVTTRARAWSGRDVLVDVRDVRHPTLGVWLDAADVTRVSGPGPARVPPASG